MGEKYIKEEDGKEVLYERGPLWDYKVGDLHENLGGDKETRNTFGSNVKVGGESSFGLNRRAEVDGEQGEFRRDFFGQYTFKPDPKDSTNENDSSSNGDYDSGGADYTATCDRPAVSRGHGWIWALIISFVAIVIFANSRETPTTLAVLPTTAVPNPTPVEETISQQLVRTELCPGSEIRLQAGERVLIDIGNRPDCQAIFLKLETGDLLVHWYYSQPPDGLLSEGDLVNWKSWDRISTP